jgi:transposase
MIGSLQDQLQRIDGLEQDIDRLEQRMGTWQKQEAACRAITAVPGIGKLTATALVATMGDAKTFKSGREFASFLGLVPRQRGTGVPAAGSAGIDLQVRRPVLAHAADPLCAIGDVPR